MRTRTIALILASLALTVALHGCGGGGAKVQSEISTTTTGQELLDLKKAYDSGAISESEYKRLRQQVLERSK